MKTNFLFMDDWSSPPIDKAGTTMSALTGILVPVERYADLRHKFYLMHRKWIMPAPNTIGPPLDLHGSDMLRDKSDDEKLEAYSMIARFLVDSEIPIFRVGYYVTDLLRREFKLDGKFINTCWFGMVSVLQPYYQSECIIPVMDTCNPDIVPKFSAMIRQMDAMRTTDIADSISIENSQNILGEVFFADSRFAAFVQTADVAGYLRSLCDLHRERWSFSAFKLKLLEVARLLDPLMVYEQTIAMRFTDRNGVETVNGPRHDGET